MDHNKDVLRYLFVLLLRWMLNLFEKRSGACGGGSEWAFAALILTHLNDERFNHFVGGAKHATNTIRENKRKESE